MPADTEPATLGPADVADQVETTKRGRGRPPKKPKRDAMLNALANDLAVESPRTLTHATALCTHGNGTGLDAEDAMEKLLRNDERFLVYLQGNQKFVVLVSSEKNKAAETPTLSEQVAKRKPDMFDRIDADMDADMAAAAEAETKADSAVTNPPIADTKPAEGGTETIFTDTPTIGELAAQVVSETKVMETISKMPTVEERLQFEIACHMKHKSSMAKLGAVYQQLKTSQGDLQAEMTEINKQLKDCAKKLAALAVETVDTLYQDPIPFASGPKDAPSEEETGLKDEEEDALTTVADGVTDATATIQQGITDLSHIDNPGSGHTNEPLQFPGSAAPAAAASAPASEDDQDAPPMSPGTE